MASASHSAEQPASNVIEAACDVPDVQTANRDTLTARTHVTGRATRAAGIDTKWGAEAGI